MEGVDSEGCKALVIGFSLSLENYGGELQEVGTGHICLTILLKSSCQLKFNLKSIF